MPCRKYEKDHIVEYAILKKKTSTIPRKAELRVHSLSRDAIYAPEMTPDAILPEKWECVDDGKRIPQNDDILEREEHTLRVCIFSVELVTSYPEPLTPLNLDL